MYAEICWQTVLQTLPPPKKKGLSCLDAATNEDFSLPFLVRVDRWGKCARHLTQTNERHSQDNERHSHQTSYCKLLRFTLAPSFSKLLNLMQPQWCLTNHFHFPCSGQQRRQPRRTPPQLSGLHCGFALCTAPGQTHAKHRSATHPSFTQATAQPHFCYVTPHPVFSLGGFFTNTTIAQITE